MHSQVEKERPLRGCEDGPLLPRLMMMGSEAKRSYCYFDGGDVRGGVNLAVMALLSETSSNKRGTKSHGVQCSRDRRSADTCEAESLVQ